MMQGQLSTSMASPFRVVVPYFIAAIASWVVLNLALAMIAPEIRGHYFQPHLLALTHTATLLWIGMTIMGAMYQLVPVVLEVPLYSKRLPVWAFWIYLIGASGMVVHFWSYAMKTGFVVSAFLVFVAFGLFIINISLTMRRVRAWNLTGLCLLSSLVYLFLAASLGLVLGVNLNHFFIRVDHIQHLKVHAHLAFAGWVTMVIMGAVYKLIPMFTLSHGTSTKPGIFAFVALHIGVIGLTVELLFGGGRGPLLGVYAGVMTAGIGAFLVQVALILKYRMRKAFDIGMKHALVSFIALIPTVLLGDLFAIGGTGKTELDERFVLAYGFLIIFAYISFLIVGQMYKIVPFLVWFHKYSDKVGLEPVPLLREMFSERTGEVQFILMVAATVSTLGGLLIGQQGWIIAGVWGLSIAAVIFAYNMYTVFRK
ncbi:MAG: cbb3-type cytochrome c oxidase subunit I [Candidatus Latescibacteria bacterium]|nr:cbb3-type cytochrome c oxidase subunit I [Candidatus Latescibacterota bacterium]